MNNLEIALMSDLDLIQLEKFLTVDFDDFWNFDILKNELNNSRSQYITAKINHKIVGFAGIWDGVEQMHITNIVVCKDCRNQRIGSQLLEHLIVLTKQNKHKYLTLEVNEKNLIAQKLYLKYNFKVLGIRKKYYNNTDNALIMTLEV